MSKLETRQRMNRNTYSSIKMSISRVYNQEKGQHLSGYKVVKGLRLESLEQLIKNGIAYAPVEYENGYRKYVEGKTIYLNTVIIDIDNDMQSGKEILSVERAKVLLRGYKYLIVATKSSGIESDKNPSALERYRIIIPLNRDIGTVDTPSSSSDTHTTSSCSLSRTLISLSTSNLLEGVHMGVTGFKASLMNGSISIIMSCSSS